MLESTRLAFKEKAIGKQDIESSDILFQSSVHAVDVKYGNAIPLS